MAEGIRPLLIFIPDITGYTKFIEETELEHSQHILAELLEIIIDSDDLDLSVSEIEGDAVLFYKFGESPDINEIMAQSKHMFMKFHEHLKKYESQRICECGACTTAQNLSLKFVVHYGNAAMLKVRDHAKIMGSDVNLVHRLMKNDIKEREYVLITEKHIAQLKNGHGDLKQDWTIRNTGSSTYDDIGRVNYEYYPMTSLLSEVAEPPLLEEAELKKNPVSASIEIHAPKDAIFMVAGDPHFKEMISNGKIKVEALKDHVPRIGTSHKCILPGGITLSFELAKHERTEKKIILGEKNTGKSLARGMMSLYIIEDQDNGTTKVILETHYPAFPIGWWLDLAMRSFIRKKNMDTLNKLKNHIEKTHKKESAAV